MTETAKYVGFCRVPGEGTKVLESWASNSRRYLEWVTNKANSKGHMSHNQGYFWWVGKAPYPMPVTVYGDAPDFPFPPEPKLSRSEP